MLNSLPWWRVRFGVCFAIFPLGSVRIGDALRDGMSNVRDQLRHDKWQLSLNFYPLLCSSRTHFSGGMLEPLKRNK